MDTRTLEIEGKSIDEAIEKACSEFGVTREKLNIEIISEEAGGFLGMLSKKAKIRASLLSFDMDFDFSERSESKSEKKEKGEKKPAREQDKTPAPGRESSSSGESTTLALRAKELLEGILHRMSLLCGVNIVESDEKIVLNIEGGDSGLLIGKRGQNLDALQYILNKAINKSNGERKIISIDSGEYRRRREESLLELAEKVRHKVKKTRKPVSLGHMSAHDRRIIHLALQEDELLTTKSRGEGEYRKIVVLPAKKGKAVQNSRQNQG
ncbi:MAG TPA: KH domain-containing protein [Deltaproteobacteria bacterium]|nr:KH domain-containing protein [Deltaproteobacteria bacterium]